MVMKISPLITLLLLLFVVSCQDETLEINSLEAFDDFLEEEMSEQDIPALSVLLFEGSSIKYEKYLGQSDIQNAKALTQDDIFLMASVSKMVTGVALLQLYEAGLFDLDDSINDYLPFSISVPNQSVAISFRMLLTHTSAIEDGPNAEIFYSYGKDSPLALKNYLEAYLVAGGEYYNASDNFYNQAPGVAHNYSNMASALIGVLVEEIAGQDFRSYCREHIFQPLNMDNTYWSLDAALQSNKTLVKPYEYSGGDFKAIEHYTFPDYPNGALRSTPRNMMQFLSALAQDGFSNNHQLLKASTVAEMLRQQIPNLDSSIGLHAFLLDEDNNLWGHDGSEQGVSTEVGFNPSTDIGVVVLSNKQDVDVSTILLEAYAFGLKQ